MPDSGSIDDGSTTEDRTLLSLSSRTGFCCFKLMRPFAQVRRMVIGKKGAVIGEIGITARAELSVIFKKKVHLYLEVKGR
jgi:hypothetical protein